MTLLAKALAPVATRARVPSSPSAAGAIFSDRRRHLWLFAVIAALVAASTASAEVLPELRVATSYQGKFDANVYAAAWYAHAPRWTRAHNLEIAAGVIDDGSTSRPFLFTGPVWRMMSQYNPLFLEASFGPTVIGGSEIDGRNLGGNLHFRSALAFGRFLGASRSYRVAIRLQHISNGGLREENPGFDSIGLSFTSGL